jgi:hypothetical protein
MAFNKTSPFLPTNVKCTPSENVEQNDAGQESEKKVKDAIIRKTV